MKKIIRLILFSFFITALKLPFVAGAVEFIDKIPTPFSILPQPQKTELLKIKKPRDCWYGEYEKRFTVEINNPNSRYLENHPIIIDVLEIQREILSFGPVRSLVRVHMDNIRSETKEYTVTMFMSAFAENRFSKQDIIITAEGADSVVYSPGIEKLHDDEWHINTQAGMLASWGLMNQQIKEIGLGLMFYPEEFLGYSENALDRYRQELIGPKKLKNLDLDCVLRLRCDIRIWRQGIKNINNIIQTDNNEHSTL